MHGSALVAALTALATMALIEIVRGSVNRFFATRKTRGEKEREHRKDYQEEIDAWQDTSDGWKNQVVALKGQILELKEQITELISKNETQARENEQLHNEIDDLRGDVGEVLIENRTLRDFIGDAANAIPRARLKVRRARAT